MGLNRQVVFFVFCYPNGMLFTVLTLQLSIVRSCMNWQAFNGTYGQHNLIWMIEFHCQLWIDRSVLLVSRKQCFMLCQVLLKLVEEFTKNTVNRCQSFKVPQVVSVQDRVKKICRTYLLQVSFSQILNIFSRFQSSIKVI